jgi:hypothetical protein
MVMIIIQFCIYLGAELNSQGLIAEEGRIQNGNNKTNTEKKHIKQGKKLNHLSLFQSKHVFLIISVDLKTALAAEAHPVEERLENK